MILHPDLAAVPHGFVIAADVPWPHFVIPVDAEERRFDLHKGVLHQNISSVAVIVGAYIAEQNQDVILRQTVLFAVFLDFPRIPVDVAGEVDHLLHHLFVLISMPQDL